MTSRAERYICSPHTINNSQHGYSHAQLCGCMVLQLLYVVCVCGVVCINMYDCSQDVHMCDIWGMCVIVDCAYVYAFCNLSMIVAFVWRSRNMQPS